MDKKHWYKLFLIVSILLTVGFCIRVGADYFNYFGAMPFGVLLVIRCAEFLLPAIAAYVIARICKAKYN